jgi:probable HAF family extracellular repeat protein
MRNFGAIGERGVIDRRQLLRQRRDAAPSATARRRNKRGYQKEAAMLTTETKLTARQAQVRGCLLAFPLALLIVVPVGSLAETAESFDCPDSFFTEARSINDRGDIVGICEDDERQHGFLLRNGVFKRIDGPEGAGHTAAFGINNRGDVVGRYDDAGGITHGFLLRRGRYTTLDPPGSILTVPRGIDDRGRIVGDYRDSAGVLRGFIRDARGYRDIVFPGSFQTAARGINVRTQIVGGYDRFHAFILKNGVFATIDRPGAAGTRAHGINVLGQVVGEWSGDPECPDCFTNAFLLTTRGFRDLEFPTALETLAFGINARGQVVGHYLGQDEVIHGYVLDPDSD